MSRKKKTVQGKTETPEETVETPEETETLETPEETLETVETPEETLETVETPGEEEAPDDAAVTDTPKPNNDIVLGRLTQAAKSLNKAFKDGTASVGNQKVLFNSIKQALKADPSETVKILESIGDDCPLIVDKSSLRFDHQWDDHDIKYAYNALFAMLSVKAGELEPHYMDVGILKNSLSAFGENSFYLASLYTEV